jgi:hypothetical protein
LYAENEDGKSKQEEHISLSSTWKSSAVTLFICCLDAGNQEVIFLLKTFHIRWVYH